MGNPAEETYCYPNNNYCYKPVTSLSTILWCLMRMPLGNVFFWILERLKNTVAGEGKPQMHTEPMIGVEHRWGKKDGKLKVVNGMVQGAKMRSFWAGDWRMAYISAPGDGRGPGAGELATGKSPEPAGWKACATVFFYTAQVQPAIFFL